MSQRLRQNPRDDAAKEHDFRRNRDTHEPDAMRQARERAVAAREVMSAIRALHALGGIADVFGRLPPELYAEPPSDRRHR